MIRRFIKDESGMETIEFVVILAIIAGLIGIVAGIGTRMKTTGGAAEGEVNKGLDSIDQTLGVSGG